MATESTESGANGLGGVHAASGSDPAVDAALRAVTREFRNLVADLDDLVRATGTLSGEELARARARLQARIGAARDYLSELSGELADRARSGAAAVDDYVKERPWRLIGIGAATGLLAGWLLGRRR